MARQISIVMTIAVLTALLFSVQGVWAAEYGETENSITHGLSWLATQQNDDGSWGPSPTSIAYGDRVARTGLAVMIFIDFARKYGMEPFDPSYQYFNEVQKGIDFIKSRVQNDDGSIWDSYPFSDEVTLNKVYETSIAIMALSRTEVTPENTQTIQDAVTYLASAQNDDGGWSAMESYGSGQSDQLDTGFAALALRAAGDSSFPVTIPESVFSSLSSWVTDIQDSSTGGSYYMLPQSWENMLTTGHLLTEMAVTGDSGQPVQDAIGFMSDTWALDYASGGWQVNYPAIFATMTGFTSQGVVDITVQGMTVDWFDEMSTVIIDNQITEDESHGYWDDGTTGGILYGDRIFDTELALLTLLARNPPVVSTNTPPVTVADSYHVDEDTALNVPAPGVLVNDVDVDLDPLTVVQVAGPSYGTLTLNADGSFTYTPNPNFNGADSFTYMANDGTADSNVATVTIAVTPVNDPPNTNPAYPSISCLWPPNHTFIDVTIKGVTDPDGDPVTIRINTITSDEPLGEVKGAGGKAHDPDAVIKGEMVSLLRAERSGNDNGRVYAISFTASDGMGGASTRTVTVCVPHDQSTSCSCIDDGQRYDATKIA